ncbi:MAG: hypothetical protein ABI120_10430 [Gemmatimonadaceae bacterium]
MQDNDEFDEAELQALGDRARALPRDIPPAPETWAKISARIERSRVREFTPRVDSAMPVPTSDDSSALSPARTSRQRTRIALGAAAALFIAVTTFAVLREHTDETTGGSVAAAPESSSPRNSPVASPSIESVFARYDEAASDLTKDLAQRRSRLQPEAIAVIDSCLTTIDRAIEESRTALADEPNNTTIAELLQLTYQQKVDLLRRAAELPLGSL